MAAEQRREVMAMLSEKQLQEIRERAEQVPGSSLAKTQKDVSRAFFDRATLLEEVERLNVREERLTTTLSATQDVLTATASQNAAMREVVEWAAHQEPRVDDDMYEKAQCPGCGSSFHVLGTFDWDAKVAALVHALDCPVTKARAILAQPE